MNWIKKFILNIALSKLTGGKMDKIKAYLAQKKTYVNLIMGVGIGVAMAFGVVIPDWAFVIVGALTGITYKMGQNRTENATKELLEAVKEQLKKEQLKKDELTESV